MMNVLRRALLPLLSGLMLAPRAGAQDETVDYDPATMVRVPVADFVAPDLVKGESYTLADEAVIMRSIAVYTLTTPFGEEQLVGTSQLLERIAELRAIETLEAMKKTEVYTDALKGSAKAPVRFAKGLFSAPVDTLKGAAQGFGGYLADVGYSVVSDDPSQENAAKTALGFAVAKRGFAHQLGVNPYSTYQPMQEPLGEVAWTAVGGGLTVSAAFRAVQNTPGQVLRFSKTANSARELVRDKSPRELQNRNEEALLAMGINADLVEAMLNNFHYDPEAETRLVSALESMEGVAGRGEVVARSALAATSWQAELVRDWLELLAAYHERIQPAERLVILSTAPFLVDGDKVVHGVFPTDYFTWTPAVEQRVQALGAAIDDAGLNKGPMYTVGKIDDKMRQLVVSQGWTDVHQHAGRLLFAEPQETAGE
jgi:hypothetical protein